MSLSLKEKPITIQISDSSKYLEKFSKRNWNGGSEYAFFGDNVGQL